MDSRLYRAMTALLWLAVPLTAFQYWSVWDQLPARMATHFGVSGQPNGWMPRETSLIFATGLTVFLLVIFTWALTRIRKPDILAWSLLAMFFVMIGVLFSINNALLDYNIYNKPLNIVPAMIAVFLASFALVAIALTAKRGAELPRHAEVVAAEEVHAAPLWGLVFAILTGVEVVVIAVIPQAGLRFVMALPVVLLLGAAALAWGGFHYRFSAHGVEISTLGFRLRSIPLQSIKAYAIAPWSALGGYGIRGIGEKRAYVWGNTGVRIMLSDGEVFLGHREPEKIMNDLNMIREHQKVREHT
ncbi:MAG TPA: DUF1648 domain-containing protein [Terriglobales bacterium]|nr:DUF1648 domain-containing protein [Terriglobales bacterium]